MDTTEAMWTGVPEAISKARADASAEKAKGEILSAHSIMLSAYISCRDQKPRLYGLLALWHVSCLLPFWGSLNHKQLDILLSPVMVMPRWCFWVLPSFSLERIAEKALSLAIASSSSKPHQLALAHLTYAFAHVRSRELSHSLINPALVSGEIESAAAISVHVFAESNQPQGLRQLVRIYRRVGELSMHKDIGEFERAGAFLELARDLAMGLANAPSQIPRIAALLEKLPK